jgi:hypothetical protein
MTDSMSESYQWLIIYLNHTISHWYDSDILSVTGMIQIYYLSLVWFRHIIRHWYEIIPMTDSMSESHQWLIIYLNHTNHWWYVWIIPMTDSMSESYQWLIIYLNHTNHWWYVHWYDSDILSVIGMIQKYYLSLVWFRHIISDWYDSGILSVIGVIQTYYQALVSESYQWLIICLNHANHWWYVWTIPMTDSMSESYQWLIVCLNHTNPVIGMIQTYHQWLVLFRYIISHWCDSDILLVSGMIQTY